MEQKFTLSELNNRVKEALSRVFPTTVWVVAEISELKENRSGHCYMELVEKLEEEITARARATIWSYTYRMLKPYFETTTGQFFSAGIKVLVQVSVEFHAVFGYSLNIKDIDPTYTVGDMALQRLKIINRLKEEGVFEMNKELELPLVPQKIAVISSATAAGYQDFMDQLEGNEFGFKFYTKLFQAAMQGADTVPSLIRALEHIYKYEDFFDAVVIIRGGGATADLSSFDNYDLAVNISQFPLPVITGIGHQKDDTVIDLVAHTRMKTPTAVAEFLVSGVERFYERLIELENKLVESVYDSVETKKTDLGNMAENFHRTISDFITEKESGLTKTGNRFQQNVTRFAFNKKYELNHVNSILGKAVSVWFVENQHKIEQKKRILNRLVSTSILKNEAQLVHVKNSVINESKKMLVKEHERIHFNENAIRLLNPENVLDRGYTITSQKGKIVKSAKELTISEEIETQFADGTVKSKIIKKNKNGN